MADLEIWQEGSAVHLVADGDLFQTAAVAVAFIPGNPWKPPEPSRLILQRGPRNWLPEIGTQVSIDEGSGHRTRGVVHARARYSAGSAEETVVLIVLEFVGR
jgi:hypothetical protein